MAICAKIGSDLKRSCTDKPVLGIEQKIVLINTEDLPRTGITFDTALPNSLITGLQLNTNTKGYEIEGFKQVMGFSNTLETAEDSENGVIQSLTGFRIYNPSETAKEQLNSLIGGANLYAVVERKWKGTSNNHAFLFFGLQFGLEITDLNEASAENDGTATFSLATPAGFKEPLTPHILRITDYATTLTAFNNKFEA